MKKTIARLTLCALLFALSTLPARAQQPKTIARIGFLGSSSAELDKSRLAAFRQGLRDLGYIESNNIVIEQRYAAGQFEALPKLAAELFGRGINVLVTEGTPAASAAKNANRVIPIVMGNAGDPVGTGLVASLARPGGNVTGLSDFSTDLVTKRLEILKDVVPTASRVAVMFNPGNPTNPRELKEIQAVAPALRVTILLLAIEQADQIERAFTVINKERPAGLIMCGDPLLGSQRKNIARLAIKHRLPVMYGRNSETDGGLMSYGTDFENLFRRAATYVDKILKGTKPADPPVEQPTKFEFVINLKTAKQIGLTIPPTVLVRAEKVIKEAPG